MGNLAALMPKGISTVLVNAVNVNERAVGMVMANLCLDGGSHE
jgi:hypothetical protein